MTNNNRRQLARVRNAFLGATALAGIAAVSTPASAIVINDAFTPTQAVDTAGGVNGVGQMIVDEQNGFIGLCTVSLINPRTVIFASHCVNENPDGNAFMPATGYGKANGGLPIGFFFNVNNNQAGNSAIGHWLNGVGGGAKDLTRTADFAYNSNFVVYNTNCCGLGLTYNFIQSDIAIAALDTPAVGIPTYTLLFSALSGPAHATITGYGDNGIGSTGQGTIDFKRRVAENIVSVLGSLDDQNTFLFGAPRGMPANLYMMDFNDPKFNTAQANVFDFNIFHDTATPNEGITAPGDSGGPLIIDHQFSAPTIAAVLSGGNHFFNAQQHASYGTTAFYQPLYLYWDWILANNPYKYVTSTAGDHNWRDANAFVMALDPAYVVAGPGNSLVNALPTTAAQGQANVPPGFGFVCYFDDCINIKTGAHSNPTPAPAPNPTDGQAPATLGLGLGQAGFEALVEGYIAAQGGNGAASHIGGGGADQVLASLINIDNNAAAADGSNLAATASGGPSGPSSAVPSAQADWANPEGTALAGGVQVQGAPGASPGQVIQDTDANVATLAPARYYDVTVAAAGTVTLDTGTITVDKVTVFGASAGLTVATGATLNTLISTNSFAGELRVNGNLNSTGALSMFGGLLSGTGAVHAPSIDFLLGAIAPGTNGTIGTLNVVGNLHLSLGATSVFDVGPSTADLLNVTGLAAIDGTAAVSFTAGAYTMGAQYTLLTASGGISGSYAASMFANMPAGVIPVFSYDANDVFLTLTPAPFIWSATPASGDYQTAADWQYNLTPGIHDLVQFDTTSNSNVTVIGESAAAGSLQFNAGAPAYTFAVTGNGTASAGLVIDTGIVDNSANAPSFTLSGASAAKFGVLVFNTSGNAADATITANNFGVVLFLGTSDAGAAAALAANGSGQIDFSGTTGQANNHNVSAGSLSGTGGTVLLGANTLTVGALNTDTVFGGAIGGAGALTKVGTGTLALSGNNSYLGATTITGGTLQIGNGGASGGVLGNIVDNATLAFNRSDTIGFSNVISGSGNVSVTGTGNIVLTGANTYSGTTTVTHGTLTVNGSIGSSAVTVQTGASLAGTGTVGPTGILAGGAIAPGTNGTIGTLTIGTSLTFAAGSTSALDVNGSTSDLIKVNGATSLNGTPALHFLTTPKFSDTAVLLESTTIAGAYVAPVDNVPGVLSPVITKVTAGAVQREVLTFKASPFSSILGAGTDDQTRIGQALDDARASFYPALKPLYDALDPLTGDALGQALEDLAPDAERAATLVGEMESDGYSSLLWQHLGEMGGSNGTHTAGLHINGDGLKMALSSASTGSAQSQQFLSLGASIASNPGGGNAPIGTGAPAAPTAAGDSWMSLGDGTGGFVSGSSLNGTVGIGGGGGKADVRGYVIGGGLDTMVAPNLDVGVSVAYSSADAVLRAVPSALNSHTTQGALYARYDFPDHFIGEAFVSYGGQDIKTQRTVVVGLSTFNIAGKTSGDSTSVGVYIGHSVDLSLPNGAVWNFTPGVGVQFTSVGIDGFSETGGAPAMTFHDYNSTSGLARFGLDTHMTVHVFGIPVTPNAHLFYVDNFSGDNGTIQSTFAAAPGSLISFAGVARDQSYGELGAGLDFDLSGILGTEATLSGRYDATADREDLSYDAWTGRLSIKF